MYLDNQIQKLKQEKYNGQETGDFFNDCERLKNGEPYEYVLGYTRFLGTHIDLSLRPMIPRYESAFWVERAILELKEKQKTLGRPLRLAETFAGAGAIGIALLTHLPDAHVTISEIDPKLKRQIEINVEKNNIDPSRVTVITASGLDGLRDVRPTSLDEFRGTSDDYDQAIGISIVRGVNERSDNEIRQAGWSYDGIFAVPPYIPYECLPELDQEMIEYEPHLAFLAHHDGHEFHEILIRDAWDLLEVNGTLYMEADMGHEEWITKRVQDTAWSKLELWPDPYGAMPNAVLRK